MKSVFDTKTLWPKEMPADFNPTSILENGMKPGLGLKALHEKGFDGRGIGIAIIDQPLLTNHEEYIGVLKSYEEISVLRDSRADFHASAVASIAVGKNIGVAPGAELYYIAWSMGKYKADGSFTYDMRYLAKAIDRIIEINRSLDNKIRIISVSLNQNNMPYKNEAYKAIERARKEGIETISVMSLGVLGA